VGGRRKRFADERERPEGEEREPRWLLGDRMVDVLASYDGVGGEKASGSMVRRLEQWRGRDRNGRKLREVAGFSSTLDPVFFIPRP